MEADVANGITQLVVGAAIAVAIGAAVALTPIHRPKEDVAFLERLAATVERAKVIAPETRDYLSALASRHQSQLFNDQLELRRQKALERIMAAMRPPDPVETPVLESRHASE
jgi:hypothetical protein